MSLLHLRDLRNSLERSHWIVIEELEGNDYDISAVWVIARPDGSNKLHIEFSVPKDLTTPPTEKSVGCQVAEYPKVSLYFAKVSRSWKDNLTTFIQELNQVAA